MVRIRPLHPPFAGEVAGVALRRPLAGAAAAAMRGAFERLSVPALAAPLLFRLV